MRRAVAAAWAMILTVVVLAPAAAQAATPAPAYPEPAGTEHLKFAAGPYRVTPGANLILTQLGHVPKPNVDGYMVRMIPNLHYVLPNGKCCGAIPRVDVVHLHHGVWLSDGVAGRGEGNGQGPFYPFMASGEEKTIYNFPAGYGYPIGGSDAWIFNYMIHNLTNLAKNVYVTYQVDFLPMTAPAAATIKTLHPIWMDVMDHHIYPVFDVLRHSGRNGKYTFPEMAKNPYGGSAPLDEFTVDHPGTLISTAGHVHPGGLYTDLDLIRSGATPSGGAVPGSEANSVRLFQSNAHYWDPRGPISWDMAMTGTPADWRPAVQAGDTLRVSATYETKRASWYESMGIMVVWEAWNDAGTDPFTHAIDEHGAVTHGHLAENNNHGGASIIYANPAKFRSCETKSVTIASFLYLPGDLTAKGANRCVPTVKQGQSLTFTNQDASPQSVFSIGSPSPYYLESIFHTVTTCQSPCGLNTGISYPLANGAGNNLDSGQLGIGTPAIGQLSWSTPKSLKPGTYTYFCRIHPFMRGVFRIIS